MNVSFDDGTNAWGDETGDDAKVKGEDSSRTDAFVEREALVSSGSPEDEFGGDTSPELGFSEIREEENTILSRVACIAKSIGSFIPGNTTAVTSGIITFAIWSITLLPIVFCITKLPVLDVIRIAVCTSSFRTTSIASSFGCGPLAAPLDPKDPAFIAVLAATESSRIAAADLSRGLGFHEAIRFCFVPECKNMQRELDRMESDMTSVSTSFSFISNTNQMFINRLMYDAQSSTDALDYAQSIFQNDTTMVSRTRLDIADYIAGRFPSTLQFIDAQARDLQHVKQSLANFKHDMCSLQNTVIVFEPLSYASMDWLWGQRWKAESISLGTGQRTILSYASGEMEALRHAAGIYTSSKQSACNRVVRAYDAAVGMESALSEMRSALEEQSRPSTASLVSRLHPKIQSKILQEGLAYVAKLHAQFHELILSTSRNGSYDLYADLSPAQAGSSVSSESRMGWDHVVGLFHAGVNLLDLSLREGRQWFGGRVARVRR